jgi:hypothetical protein
MIPYCNAMPWNPVNRSIEIEAADHPFRTPHRHVRYVEATNAFEVVSASTGLDAHGYDHVGVNPFTGDLYFKAFGEIGIRPLVVSKKVFGQSTWTRLPTINADQNITFGTAWWSGPFTGGSGLGAQGGFAVYSRGSNNGKSTDGFVGIYDPISNTWPFQANSMSPFVNGGYNAVMAYSSVKNVAVYGGGNNNANRLWKMNSNGAVTVMTEAPANIGIGIHTGILVEDPVTGNFLLLSKGFLYQLNPDGSGTWTQQTGSRAPPSGVGVPADSGGNNFLFGAPLPDHGVVAFIRQSNSGNGAFWLYKHA